MVSPQVLSQLQLVIYSSLHVAVQFGFANLQLSIKDFVKFVVVGVAGHLIVYIYFLTLHYSSDLNPSFWHFVDD